MVTVLCKKLLMWVSDVTQLICDIVRFVLAVTNLRCAMCVIGIISKLPFVRILSKYLFNTIKVYKNIYIYKFSKYLILRISYLFHLLLDGYNFFDVLCV